MFNEFLNMADIHLIIQKKDTSDLMMPSKLNSILASGGLCLVTASKNSSLYQTIKNNEIGICIDPENSKQLKDSILWLCTNNFDAIKTRARQFALDNLAKEKILSDFFLKPVHKVVN